MSSKTTENSNDLEVNLNKKQNIVELMKNINKGDNLFNSIIVIICILFVLIWTVNDNNSIVAFYIITSFCIFILAFKSYSQLKATTKQKLLLSFHIFIPVFLLLIPIIFIIQSYINSNIENISNIQRIQTLRLYIKSAIPFQTALIVYYLYSVFNDNSLEKQENTFILIMIMLSISTSYIGWLYNDFLQNNLTDDILM